MTYAEEKLINPNIENELKKFFAYIDDWCEAEYEHPGEKYFEPTPEKYEIGLAHSTIDIDLGDGNGEVEVPIQVSHDIFNYRMFAYLLVEDLEPVVLAQYDSLSEMVEEVSENSGMASCGDTAFDAYYYEGASALRRAYEKED